MASPITLIEAVTKGLGGEVVAHNRKYMGYMDNNSP